MPMINYMRDGANYQARAVLCYLEIYDGIEDSWNEEWKDYEARVNIGRWENCREQGYIVSLRNKKHEQLNIVWYEHRNSDSICALKWIQSSINSLNIDNATFEGTNFINDKWDVSFKVKYGEVTKMADWIYNELSEHWFKGKDK